MANPLALLRRHQRMILAACAVMAIVVFTVGSIVQDYLQTQARDSDRANEVVVTWKHGSLRESDIEDFRMNHNLTVRFLDQVVGRTLEQKGTPKGIGVIRDPQTGQIRDPGISRDDDTEQLVRTMVLARKAQSMGVVVTDEAIQDFLDELSNGLFPRSEHGAIHQQTVSKYMSVEQLFEHLRVELMAQQALVLSRPGTVSLTPSAIWDYYNRLHRRVKAEVAPLKVAEYVSKVSSDPAENELRTLYENFKDDYSHPESPEPGFKRRKKAAFEYVSVDSERLRTEEVDRIKPEITDPDITEYYEKNKNEFIIPEESAKDKQPEQEPEAGQPTKNNEKPDTQPDPNAPSDTKESVEKPKPQGSSDKSATPDSSTDKKQVDKKQVDDKQEDDDADEETKPEDGKTSRLPISAAPLFVKFVQEPAPVEGVSQEEEEAGRKAKAEVKSGDEAPPKSTADAKSSADAVKDAIDKNPRTDRKIEPDQKKSEPSSLQDGVPQTDEEKSIAAKVEPPATPPKKEPNYKPLDDALREEIRLKIANQRAFRPARERLTTAFTAVRREVESYGRQHAKWTALTAVKKQASKPTKPDFERVAEANGLEFGSLPLLDPIEVSEHDLGKGTTFIPDQGWRQITFAEIAFTDGLPMNSPQQISTQNDRDYLFWKTDERAAYVPTLDDAKQDVVNYWKRVEALKLAKNDAERLAKEARESKKTLQESMGDSTGVAVLETRDFSWLSTGSLAFGSNIPTISSVENIESPGVEFMRAMFALGVGEIGVAVNHPQSVVYVVRVLSESPTLEARRQEFLESHLNFQTYHVAMSEAEQVFADWYRDLEKEYGVKWNRSEGLASR